ncbi:MAG: TraM recognition domain-containing protein [Bacteroidota bacterium]
MEYHNAGRDVQILFKYVWQKAMQRRKPSIDPRPVFLFIDEAQNFLHELDASFLAISRSSFIANIFISQSLPNYYAFMGGDGNKNEYKVKSLLANLSMKIFCCNTCVDTNLWASELIGDGYTETTSRDVTVSGDFSSSRSMSYELEPIVRPELFGLLRQGGPDEFVVETYVHRQGKLFDNGHNFKKVIFKQS